MNKSTAIRPSARSSCCGKHGGTSIPSGPGPSMSGKAACSPATGWTLEMSLASGSTKPSIAYVGHETFPRALLSYSRWASKWDCKTRRGTRFNDSPPLSPASVPSKAVKAFSRRCGHSRPDGANGCNHQETPSKSAAGRTRRLLLLH